MIRAILLTNALDRILLPLSESLLTSLLIGTSILSASLM
jgi:hypothetical protein